jgi:tRNA G18 (ribose-2'-O)-methylase SpoU
VVESLFGTPPDDPLAPARRPVIEEQSEAPVTVLVAPPEVLDAVVGFHAHRGILGLAERHQLPDPVALLAHARLVVAVEGVNDHENMGALFRNAAAFGADAVVLDPRCCDPLYRRSVRVSLGHALRVPFARVPTWPEAGVLLRRAGLTTVALTPDSSAVPVDDALAVLRAGPGGVPARVAVLVGAEGPGLSPAALASAALRVRIPLSPQVDSLNVATAAAVVLHRLAEVSG